MPSVSEKQRKLMCLALSIKQGKTPKSRSKQAAKLAEQMTEEQLREFCEVPIKKT
jgi:hypothetical protein